MAGPDGKAHIISEKSFGSVSRKEKRESLGNLYRIARGGGLNDGKEQTLRRRGAGHVCDSGLCYVCHM